MLDLTDAYGRALEERERISERTVEQYTHKVKQFKRWALGEERAFDRATVVAYLDSLQERGLNPKTVAVAYTALRSFGRWLLQQGQPAPDLENMRLPERIDPHRRTPSDEEVRLLLATAHKMPQYTVILRQRKWRTLAMLTLFLDCGLRPGELLQLRLDDIRRYPQGPDVPPRWTIFIRRGKGKKTREVKLPEAGRRLIEEYLRRRVEWCEGREMEEPAKTALFPVSRCRRMEYRGMKRLWDELLAYAEMSETGLQRYGCRHWFGTVVAAAEDLKTAQEMLGHKSIKTTEQYLHTSEKKKDRASEALGERTHGTRAPQSRPEEDSYRGRGNKGEHVRQRRPVGSARGRRLVR